MNLCTGAVQTTKTSRNSMLFAYCLMTITVTSRTRQKRWFSKALSQCIDARHFAVWLKKEDISLHLYFRQELNGGIGSKLPTKDPGLTWLLRVI